MKVIKILIATILALILLALIVFPTLVVVPAVQRTSNKSRQTAQVRKTQAPDAASMETPFEADIYPSQRAAAKQLAERFATEVSKVTKDRPKSIRVVGPSAISVMAYDDLKRSLQLQYPGASFHMERGLASSLEHASAALWSRLTIKAREGVRAAGQENTPIDPPISALIPTIANIPTPAILSAVRAQLAQPDVSIEDILGSSQNMNDAKELIGVLSVSGSRSERMLTLESVTPAVSASISYVEKPWADDFKAYKIEKGGSVLMARSASNSPTPAEAMVEAKHLARVSLVKVLGNSIHRARFTWHNHDDEIINDHVDNELEKERFIIDTFSQRFDRPYGMIFREALLIDSSQKKLDQLASEINRQLDQNRNSTRKVFFSVAGLFVLTYVLYLFVNSITKGYFVWRLRTVALLLASGGVLLLIYVM